MKLNIPSRSVIGSSEVMMAAASRLSIVYWLSSAGRSGNGAAFFMAFPDLMGVFWKYISTNLGFEPVTAAPSGAAFAPAFAGRGFCFATNSCSANTRRSSSMALRSQQHE